MKGEEERMSRRFLTRITNGEIVQITHTGNLKKIKSEVTFFSVIFLLSSL